MKPIVELTEVEFDHAIGINLKGVWLSIKYEVEAMLAQGRGGVIVNTSSFLARGAVAGSSVYSASKGALEAMIRAVARSEGRGVGKAWRRTCRDGWEPEH